MSPPITPYTLSPHVASLLVRDGRVVYADGSPRRSRVAICGSAGVRQMPWDDPTVECWALNNFYNMARDSQGRLAASRWFEQHQITPSIAGPHAGQAIQDAHDLQWLRECPVPIYTTEPFPANPRAVVWPIDDFARKYRDYFVCTFAMQIVQAIDEGFEELIVCGLELLLGTRREATVEHGCVCYWLGLAEGRGMMLRLAPRDGRWNGDGWTIRERVDGQCAAGRMRPADPWLLRHPFWYGHQYWEEADLVLQYLERWDERAAAI